MQLGMLLRLKDGFSGVAAGAIKRLHDLKQAAQEASTIAQVGAHLTIVGQGMTQLGQRALSAAGAVLTPFMEVEDAAAALRTVLVPAVGTVDQAMQSAVSSAKAFSEANSASATAYLKTAYLMAGAGLKAEQAIQGTEVALRVAAATFGTGEDAANFLSTAFNNFGDTTADVRQEMTRLGDIITQTQGVFQIANLKQLQDGFVYGNKAAQAYGVELEQLMAVVGQLNSAGMQGSMAGTAVNATVSRLSRAAKELGFGIERNAKGGVDLIRTLVRLRAQFGATLDPEVADRFNAAFGEEGAAGIVLLLKNLDKLKANYVSVSTGAAGATEKAFAIVEDTTASKLKSLKNRFDNTLAAVGEKLVPAMEKLLPILATVLDKVASFVAEHPDFTAMAAGVLVFGGAALAILGPFIQLGGVLMGAYAAMRMVQAATAVTAAGGAVARVGLLSRAWSLLGGGIGGVRDAFVRFGSVASGGLTRLIAMLGGPVGAAVAGLGVAIVALIFNWDEVQDALVAGFEWLEGAWDKSIDWGADAFQSVEDMAREAWSDAGTWLGGAGDAWADVLRQFGNSAARTWDDVKASFSSVGSWFEAGGAALYDSAAKFWGQIKAAAQAMWRELRTWWQGELNWFVDKFNVFNVGGESTSQKIENIRAKTDLAMHEAMVRLQAEQAMLPAPGELRQAPENGGPARPAPAAEPLSKVLDSGSSGPAKNVFHIGNLVLPGVQNPDDLARTLQQRSREAA